MVGLTTMNLAGSLAKTIAAESLRNLADPNRVSQLPPPSPTPPERGPTNQELSQRAATIIIWLVFAGCAVCTILGVVASFYVLGSTITGSRLWILSIVISVGMLFITYGQKYSVPQSRLAFTPVDVLAYLVQGFLWPTTWPSFAHAIGISSSISAPSLPPGKTSELLLRCCAFFLS